MRAAFSALFSDKKYVALAGAATLCVFLAYLVLINWQFLPAIFRLKGTATVVTALGGLLYNVFLALDAFSLISLPIIALLAGINIALLVMRLRMMKGTNARESSTSFLGLVAGAFAAGCPACATGLLALMGVAGGLAALPFHGVELKIASIALLSASIFFISKSLSGCKSCRV